MSAREIKSTLEIAMEKMAKLPRLTPEEIREQKAKEFEPRGRAIAERCLEDVLQPADLEIELAKFQDEERELVWSGLQSTLCEAVALEDMGRSRRALEGLQALRPDAGLEERTRALEAIHAEYLDQRVRTLAEIEKRESEGLRALGISGSAIRPNPEASPEAHQRLEEARQTFGARVEDLRAEISRTVAGSPSGARRAES
jgi:hypothetical protein